jgi:hypothetical protein
MAVLSLREAAEQTGTSKVDIWRAIRSGMLPAQRTHDGDFAIDPAELFRVFETQRPEQRSTEQDATASPAPRPESGATPESAATPETTATPETAVTNDMTVAFAALQAELRGMLAGVRANDELR